MYVYVCILWPWTAEHRKKRSYALNTEPYPIPQTQNPKLKTLNPTYVGVAMGCGASSEGPKAAQPSKVPPAAATKTTPTDAVCNM